MLKRDITFEDFDGKKVTETFYFNITKVEALDLNFYNDNMDLESYVKKIVQEENHKELIQLVKTLIVKGVGVRSEDGRRFVKSEEITNDFIETNAFSELFMELATDADAAAAFFNGIVPRDISEETAKPQDHKKKSSK